MKKIYSLVDPITKEVRYIGQTKNKLNARLNGHIQESKAFKYNIPKCEWVTQLLNNDLFPLIVELECVTNKNADEREDYWINHYRQFSDLFNLTTGNTHGRSNEYCNIYAINKYTNERMQFESQRQAAKCIGVFKENIAKAISGKYCLKDFYWSKIEFSEDWKIPPVKNRIGVKLSNEKKIVYLPSVKEAIEFTGGNVASHKNGASYALSHKGKEYRGYFWEPQSEANLKPGELLEKPVEVNQQPSLDSNILEGSTTSN